MNSQTSPRAQLRPVLSATKRVLAPRKCLSCGAMETPAGTLPCGH